MKKIALLLSILSFTISSYSQSSDSLTFASGKRTTLGVGLGLEYGGIGAQLNHQTGKAGELFAGFGYNFNGVGYNFGGKLRLGGKRVVPTLGAMYGYNAVLGYESPIRTIKKTYFGPSFGFGIEINRRRNRDFWVIDMWVPVRSKEFHDDYDYIQDRSYYGPSLPPVTVSFAYHFNL